MGGRGGRERGREGGREGKKEGKGGREGKKMREGGRKRDFLFMHVDRRMTVYSTAGTEYLILDSGIN